MPVSPNYRHAQLSARVHAIARLLSREALILLLFIAASAMTLNIFMQTRGLEEGQPRFGLASMLDGSADQPFVKRQLLPRLANFLTELVPANERDTFVQYHLDKYHLKDAYFGRARLRNAGQEIWSADYALKYHLIYFFMFASLLGTLYLLRALGHDLIPSDNPLAPVLPVFFALLLPLSYLHGNFLYDFSELFFFSALLFSAFKGSYIWWLVLLPLAVLNKETAILVPLLYAPLLYSNCRGWAQRSAMLGSLVLAGGVFWGIGQEYASNPGSDTQWHLLGNLAFWTQPANYFLWADLYVPLIPVPRGFNLLLIGAFSLLIFHNWRAHPLVLRRLFWAALLINLPLFFLFTYRDEMRNLSMLFIPTYLLATHALLLYPKPKTPSA
ncbi:MAG TPA: hypothetical protein VIN38_13970 [Thiobacillus sp.]